MSDPNILLVIELLAVVTSVSVLARRVRVPCSIALMIAGLALGASGALLHEEGR